MQPSRQEDVLAKKYKVWLRSLSPGLLGGKGNPKVCPYTTF